LRTLNPIKYKGGDPCLPVIRVSVSNKDGTKQKEIEVVIDTGCDVGLCLKWDDFLETFSHTRLAPPNMGVCNPDGEPRPCSYDYGRIEILGLVNEKIWIYGSDIKDNLLGLQILNKLIILLNYPKERITPCCDIEDLKYFLFTYADPCLLIPPRD
jgi:hypothetical protein